MRETNYLTEAKLDGAQFDTGIVILQIYFSGDHPFHRNIGTHYRLDLCPYNDIGPAAVDPQPLTDKIATWLLDTAVDIRKRVTAPLESAYELRSAQKDNPK